MELSERIGNFDFTVAFSEVPAEMRERYEHRAELLTRWLLKEWEREHGEDHDRQHLLN